MKFWMSSFGKDESHAFSQNNNSKIVVVIVE
jgi:hypothetical protein